MIEYRRLEEKEICRELFGQFIRRQEVGKCWRRVDGEWVIRDDPFVDDWTEEDYRKLVACLQNTLATGGFVYAAFRDGALKGFASVEAALFGGEQGYLDLSSIHVSQDMRGQGVGRTLFLAAKGWARERGASSTSPPTPPWRARLSTRPWAAWRRKCTTRGMWKRSLTTASWSAGCRKRFSIFPLTAAPNPVLCVCMPRRAWGRFRSRQWRMCCCSTRWG